MNWLQVKSFQFRKEEPLKLMYRYDYKDDFKSIKVHRRRGEALNLEKITLKLAYAKKLPITQAKQSDLRKLCKEFMIPTICHQWYSDLQTSSIAVDYGPEPALDVTCLEAMTD